MKQTVTTSTQDYLKHIYDLTESGKTASTNALAEQLKVKPASVTGMIQKMASSQPALVEYQKHQGVKLTKEGRKAALEVIRHHRLIETWLVQTLGYSWDEVHKEAERLEHVISEEFEARIAKSLGYPQRDPHGELIPTENLTMPQDTSAPLSSLRPNQGAIIQKIKAADEKLLRHLEELGLVPGAEVEAETYSQFDQNISLRVGKSGKSIVVGPAITNKIFIKIKKIRGKS